MFITQQVFSYLLPVNNTFTKVITISHLWPYSSFAPFELHKNVNILHELFWTWPFDLMYLCDPCMLCRAGVHSFLLLCSSTEWIYHNLIDGHLNCIQFGLLGITHLWTFLRMSTDGWLPLVSVTYQREKLQGVRTYTRLTSLVYTAKQFLKVVVPMYNPTTNL